MIKIFVNARFLSQPVSGVQRYGIECSRQIKKLYPNTVFLAPYNILHVEIAAELEAEIIGKNKGHLWEQVDLVKYLAKKDCPPLLNLANLAPLFYKNNYITIHDLAFYHHPEWNSRFFSTWYNFLIPRLARKAKHIFTVSDTVRKEIVQFLHVADTKISITYNGLSQSMLATDRSTCVKKEKIILSVGSFNKRKNHHKLLKAFLGSDLKDQYRLIIIGDKNKVFKEGGVDNEIVKANNIKILQRLSENELADIYCKAEMIVSLSLYEGFGIPIIEGLFFGCKAICSDIPVYLELYDKCAYFCNPDSISDIKNILEFATLDKNDRVDVSFLLDKYSYEKSASTIIEKIGSNISYASK